MKAQKSLTRTAAATFLIFGIFISAFGQRDSIYRLPAGTRITLKLDAELSSRVSSPNDTFVASVSRPVLIRDVVVVPAGTTVEGRVISSNAASSGGNNGRLDLTFVSLRYSNELSRSIDGSLVKGLKAEQGSAASMLSILGGAGIGALFGGLTGSGRNVLIGAGAGAGVGTAIALSRKGKDVRIAKNVEFEIELKNEVILPVVDY